MINNRQAGRRNRGRNNGRQNGGNRGGDNGNRIDNRARGNAPQLLEKYRNLARDAQLAGDRVNTEYYLQFADHYFRVIADNRARQEEQQARFRRNDDALEDDMDQGENYREDGAEQPEPGAQRSNRGYDRAERAEGDFGRGDDRRNRSRVAVPSYASAGADADNGAEEEVAPKRRPRRAEKIVVQRDASEDGTPLAEGADEEEARSAPRRAPRGRKPRPVDDADTEEGLGLDLAALPPAIARADNDGEEAAIEGEEKPAPRRRGRRPKASAEAAE